MSYMNEFNDKGDILIERLRILADGKTTINLFNEINHAALDAIASVYIFINYSNIFSIKKELRLI